MTIYSKVQSKSAKAGKSRKELFIYLKIKREEAIHIKTEGTITDHFSHYSTVLYDAVRRSKGNKKSMEISRSLGNEEEIVLWKFVMIKEEGGEEDRKMLCGLIHTRILCDIKYSMRL